MIKRLVHKLGRAYIRKICQSEFESQSFRPKEKIAEYSFVFQQLAKIRALDILDVGTGLTAFPAALRQCGYTVTCIDKVRDYSYGADGLVNRHYLVIESDILQPAVARTFDVVTCLTALQGMPDPDAAVASMFRLLNPGGRLLMTFPYNETEYVANVYSHPEAGYSKDLPYIGAVFTRRELDRWAAANHATLEAQEYWQCFTGRLWAFGERVWPPRQTSSDDPFQFTCVMFRKADQ